MGQRIDSCGVEQEREEVIDGLDVSVIFRGGFDFGRVFQRQDLGLEYCCRLSKNR